MALSFVVGKEVYKLKDIQRYCKTKIASKAVPSLNDVANTKIDNIFKDLDGIIQEGELDKMIQTIEDKINQEDYTAIDVAAAFLKMYLTANDRPIEEIATSNFDYANTGAEAGMVRLFINVGKNQRVRPGDILGAIAGETGIPGDIVGSIDMYDKYTFVEVPKNVAADVLEAMSHAKIKGKTINIEPANKK